MQHRSDAPLRRGIFESPDAPIDCAIYKLRAVPDFFCLNHLCESFLLLSASLSFIVSGFFFEPNEHGYVSVAYIWGRLIYLLSSRICLPS